MKAKLRTVYLTIDGKRKALRLGRVTASIEAAVREHVGQMRAANRLGRPVPVETLKWLDQINDGFHARLARMGLVPPRGLRPYRKSVRKSAIAEAYEEISRLRVRVSRLSAKLAGERRHNRLAATDQIPECLRELAGRLVECAVPQLEWPCVYFLLSGGVLVYIGQTNDLQFRLTSHLKDGKSFDRVLAMAVARDKLDLTESQLIRRFAPPLNRVFPDLIEFN